MTDREKCPWCGSLLHKNQVGRAWCSDKVRCRYTRAADGSEYRFQPTKCDGGYVDPGSWDTEVYSP